VRKLQGASTSANGVPAAPSLKVRGVGICAVAALLVLGCAQAPAHSSAPFRSEQGRFHHVHLNVSDIERTAQFYERTFGVVPVRYGDRAPALMAERAFIFLNQVASPIKSQLETGVIHIGWGGVDGPSEFADLQGRGIEFYAPLTRFLSGHYMYLFGPDREVVEIWTVEKHHRLNHIHMLSPDPRATAEWFARATNAANGAAAGEGLPNYWKVDFGDVALDILPDIPAFKPKERTSEIKPTDGAGIDHIAFSFANLDAALARVRAAGTPIERPVTIDPTYGTRSFFLRSPEGVLVEFVEANPIPESVRR
jgi:catechol 2,3-dioxygenase-like lactoylglutathione lyase family enzyme